MTAPQQLCRHRLISVLLGVAAMALAAPVTAEEPSQGEPVKELGRMSLADLTKVEVMSVSKTAEPINTAAAAVYVITHDEILRSGFHSIPELLRLAPNLQVNRISASSYAIAARGFAGNPPDQNFSNKLLILIDGRIIYSPLFSGIFYEQSDLMVEDIDHIEVISGPGATLWGANAVNGVINVITRSSKQTDGTLLSAAGGNQEQELAARYGARIGDAADYRVYALGFERDALQLADGSGAHDALHKGQLGFRTDWSNGAQAVTVQGDAYRGTEEQASASEIPVTGANLLARWQGTGERSELQVLAYFDHSESGQPVSGAGFVLNQYDLELQQHLRLGSRNEFVWGVGQRWSDYHTDGSATFYFVPATRTLSLTSVFAQDTLALLDDLKLTVGIKLEDDPYSHWSAMPDARLGWAVNDKNFLWSAISQAVRSPTPFDADVAEKLGTTVYLTGNPSFRTEKVTAYEAGWRTQASSWLSLSASGYYNVWTDLRTVEPSPTTTIPFYWGNLMAGDTYGVEVWADIQAAPWWRLSPGYRSYHHRLHFQPGASGLLGTSQAGDDPASNASLKSSINLGRRITFDLMFTHVASLPDPIVPAYYELYARLGWRVSHGCELSLEGFNLLQPRHQEFPSGNYIPRSGMAEVRWSF